MPFDLKTAVPVTENKANPTDMSNGFDLSTAVAVKEPTVKQGFIQKIGNNFLAGMYKGAGSFNKLIGLGAFKATESFVTSSFAEAQRLEGNNKPANKGEELALQFMQSLGELGVSLPIDVAVGGATKLALSGKVLPQISKILSRIPDFALGMGIKGAVEGAKTEGNVLEKTKEAVTKGGEELAFGTIYGSIAKLKIPVMAGIGAGSVGYKAFKEGRTPTKEEIADGAIQTS